MKKHRRIIILAALLTAAAGLLGGCAGNRAAAPEPAPAAESPAAEKGAAGKADTGSPKETRVGFYLDTVITLTAYTDHPELLDEGLILCGEYEKMLSRTVEGSDVWKINHAEGETVTVAPETAEILRAAVQVSEMSEGAFDVTIAPASVLWDFTSGEKQIPDAEALKEAASRVDYRKIRIEGNQVTLPAGMMIDLGGIAKGYIADAVKKKLADGGIRSAILSFGGNVVAIGTKPDGSCWRVGIQDIDKPTGTTMMVSLNYGGSTVTSGIYERGFEENGTIYHHILDSRTGWPVQNELASVTIFSDSSMTGDALSTAAFALGREGGSRLIEGIDGVEALFITRDRKAYGTSGIGKYMAEGESYTVMPPEAKQEAETETEKPAETGRENATLLLQVRETDPAPGYVLVWKENSAGFLPLPEEGEREAAIVQRQADGTEWTNILRMTPEGFRMTEADCEGHDCISEGEVTLENRQDRLLGNMVVCAPHRLTLYLYTPEEAAGLSRQWMGQ